MYKNILVPVAFDHQEVAGIALRVAEQLADADAHITLLNAVEPIPGYVESYIPAETRNELKKQVDDWLAGLASGSASTVGAKVVSGHAGRAIVDYAKSHDADCVVVASHKPGLEDIVFGSTAGWVVRHCPCSVHVIR